MKKVEKLTPEQEEKTPVYLKKWLNIGRSIHPLDKEKTIESVKWLYEFSKKEKTPYMWFCDSPMQAQLLVNILQNEKLLGSNLGSNLESNLWSNLESNLRSNLESNLWSNLGSNLESNLESNLWSNLESNLWSNLGSNLRSNLRSNLWSNLWSNLESNLGSNLGSNLWSNLESNLGSNLRSNNLKFEYFFSPNLESYWVGFYDFVLHEIFPERINEFKEFSENCRKFYENTYYIMPFEDICFISERPTKLGIDLDTGFLHCSNGSAMEFKDGYKIHALHNIRIEEKMLSYNAQEIMGVQNVEQRLVLIKNYGIENMLDHLDSKIENEFKDYKLHSVLLEGTREKLLEMKNPSEPKTHFEFVPPDIKTCQEALAWRFGFDVFVNPTLMA